MGSFTFTLANRKLEKRGWGAFTDYAPKCKLRYDGPGYLLCPDGTTIFEPCYNGYGDFGGHDVFALVAEWNKDALDRIFERIGNSIVDGRHPDNTGAFDFEYIRAVAASYQMIGEEAAQKVADAIVKSEKMPPFFAKEWKRCIGIEIHNYGDPPFKIKVVSCAHPRKKYEDLPASICCQ